MSCIWTRCTDIEWHTDMSSCCLGPLGVVEMKVSVSVVWVLSPELLYTTDFMSG